MHFLYRSALSTVALIGAATAAKSGPCPLIGPDFPAAKTPSSTNAIQEAVKQFQQNITGALSSDTGAFAIDGSTNSFSFEAWSVQEHESLYTLNHNADASALWTNGTQNVTSSTIYRVGSLSKLITTYIWLATVGDEYWEQPITNFIPEFAAYDAEHEGSGNNIDYIQWGNITVGALASQLADILKDPSLPAAVYGLRYAVPGLPESKDIPQDAQGLQCDTYAKVPCTRETFLNSILASHPVFAPESQPVYSDTAYSILTLALENITGNSFDDIFNTNLVQALNLKSTFSEPPKDLSNAIIPFNDSVASFTPTLGPLQPAGGFHSSLEDLTTIGKAMLASTLIAPTMTRKWMKPAAFLSNGRAVGAPWEIYQVANTNKDTWMYTKSGDFGLYSSNLVLFPEYNAGFTVLAAGPDAVTVSRIISDIAAIAFAPALEAAAKEESTVYTGDYTGSFENTAGNGTDTFEMTLALDGMGGLLVQNYTVNGIDMLQVLVQFSSSASSTDAQLRLYPTGLVATGVNGTQLQGFRMFLYSEPTITPPPEGVIFTSFQCQEWFNIGGFSSGNSRGIDGGLDEFAFVVGDNGNGDVEAIQVKTWNRNLTKI